MKQKLIRSIHALRKEFSFHGYKIKIYKDPDHDFTIRMDVFFESNDHQGMIIENNKISDIAKSVFISNRYKLPFPDLHIRAYAGK